MTSYTLQPRPLLYLKAVVNLSFVVFSFHRLVAMSLLYLLDPIHITNSIILSRRKGRTTNGKQLNGTKHQKNYTHVRRRITIMYIGCHHGTLQFWTPGPPPRPPPPTLLARRIQYCENVPVTTTRRVSYTGWMG